MEPNNLSKGTEGRRAGRGCLSDLTQTWVIKGCSTFVTTVNSGNGVLIMMLR